MEDSTSNTLQDIEKLKQKISGYRDTLMALKMGPSLDDYLIMKKEFDVLKMQISYLEDLTNTMDKKQNTQNELYEEQIKQFEFQLSLLHQAVEQLSQEILEISNKLINSKDKDEKAENDTMSKNDNAPINAENRDNKSNSILKSKESITPPSSRTSTVSIEPSFIQLRNLASPLLKKEEQENVILIEQNDYKVKPKDLRYLKSINTYPDNIYISLSNNSIGIVPQHSDLTKGYHFSHLTNELEKVNEIPSTTIKNNDLNAPISQTIESTNENVPTSINSESNYTGSEIEQKDHFLQGMAIKKVNSDAEFSDGETKKQKNSFFNNIFRK